jgi:hypothetical protein
LPRGALASEQMRSESTDRALAPHTLLAMPRSA